MNILLKFNFPKPVRIDPNSDFMAEEVTLLEVADSPQGEFLSVQLCFQDYPAIIKTIVLYSGEDYTSLGDWSYQTLINQIRDYYKSEDGAPAPESGEPPAEEPAPEPESSEAPAEEPAPTEEIEEAAE